MVGSWVDDAVWMELLHGGSLRLFLFFLRPLCNTQEEIKCKHELFRRIFLVVLPSSIICSCVIGVDRLSLSPEKGAATA